VTPPVDRAAPGGPLARADAALSAAKAAGRHRVAMEPPG
jgi:PleD family two-component response regulator